MFWNLGTHRMIYRGNMAAHIMTENEKLHSTRTFQFWSQLKVSVGRLCGLLYVVRGQNPVEPRLATFELFFNFFLFHPRKHSITMELKAQ